MNKILIFADSYIPGFRGGGPIKSSSNLVNLLDDKFEILVCTKNHDSGIRTPYLNILSDQVLNNKLKKKCLK